MPRSILSAEYTCPHARHRVVPERAPDDRRGNARASLVAADRDQVEFARIGAVTRRGVAEAEADAVVLEIRDRADDRLAGVGAGGGHGDDGAAAEVAVEEDEVLAAALADDPHVDAEGV